MYIYMRIEGGESVRREHLVSTLVVLMCDNLCESGIFSRIV